MTGSAVQGRVAQAFSARGIALIAPVEVRAHLQGVMCAITGHLALPDLARVRGRLQKNEGRR